MKNIIFVKIFMKIINLKAIEIAVFIFEFLFTRPDK